MSVVPSKFRFSLKQLEISTLSVEKTLEPLVNQVTTLVNSKGPSTKKKGKSVRPQALVKCVEEATASFILKGGEIARENPELSSAIKEAIETTKVNGEVMTKTSSAFAEDPCSSMKRGSMVRAARALLSSVTRLMILADIADCYKLILRLKLLKELAAKVRDSSNADELLENFEEFNKNMAQLSFASMARQNDLKDFRKRDDLAAARAELKKNGELLYSSSLVALHHPDIAATKANRDFIYKRVLGAMNSMSNVIDQSGQSEEKSEDLAADSDDNLALALDEFMDCVNIDPLEFNEVRHRQSLEERLESIISGAALLADSSCTREGRQERIVAECNAVRQALQDLLQEYMNSAAQGEPTDDLEFAIDAMKLKSEDLQRQLSKAVIDHVSDVFINKTDPFMVLMNAAKSGDEELVKEEAQVFSDHANKLVEVASLACSLSNDEEGVRMVKLASRQIELLCPQVINTALFLAARPSSELAQKNMVQYKHAWFKQMEMLTDAVDEVTSISTFLTVSEAHILEDVVGCFQGVNEGDSQLLLEKHNDIVGRATRIAEVVKNEMLKYEPDSYVENVVELCDVLANKTVTKFATKVSSLVESLEANDEANDEVLNNDCIECSKKVYDSVADIRRAVLLMLDPEDVQDCDSEYGDGASECLSYVSVADQPTDRKAMRDLPEDLKIKIQENVQEFVEEKKALDLEIGKWDENTNDIVQLSKSMCLVMMDLTDFTRGRGRLGNTSDVIDAAKRIASLGKNLDSISTSIADQCPESAEQKDLKAYLQRIALYCHQLNMCAKVKAEVNDEGVSSIDGATGLIQAAKNLMNSVVHVVKTSYIASTKYNLSDNISWKMKAPEKKPLIKRENVDGEKRSHLKKKGALHSQAH